MNGVREAQLDRARAWFDVEAAAIRQAAVKRIEELGEKRAAQALAMYPVGVESLLWDKHWKFEEAVLVSIALGLSVNVVVEGEV